MNSTVFRIAIAAQGTGLDDSIASDFGRCPYFLLLDSDSGKITPERNPFINDPACAAVGIVPWMHEKSVRAVICGGFGEAAVTLLKSKDIKPVQVPVEPVSQALQKLSLQSQLSAVTPHACSSGEHPSSPLNEEPFGMTLALASGKGGTGKTTLSTSIAYVLSQDTRRPVLLTDCDVEEPDCRFFFPFRWLAQDPIETDIPVIDLEVCNFCALCAQRCRFNALAVVNEQVLLFKELCRSCGLCKIVCPLDAIAFGTRQVGELSSAEWSDISFCEGRLLVGEQFGFPVVREAGSFKSHSCIRIVDCPPGVSTSALRAIDEADHCIIVTEPTPMGLHDMAHLAEALKIIEISFSVIVNKSDGRDTEVEEYCQEHNVRVLLRIPESRQIAEFSSRGIPFASELPEWFDAIAEMLQEIEARKP